MDLEGLMLEVMKHYGLRPLKYARASELAEWFGVKTGQKVSTLIKRYLNIPIVVGDEVWTLVKVLDPPKGGNAYKVRKGKV